MKICYLCADPGIPIYGRKGCSTHVRETCLILGELGHEVKLLCSNVEGDPANAAGLDVTAVEAPRSRKWGFDGRHFILDRRFGRRLERLCRDWRPDAIYERYSLYSRAGQRVAQRHGLPRLLEVNAFLTREQAGRIRVPPLARAVEKSIIRAAPRVIVVSEPLRKEIIELGVPGEAIAKMPMAVNLDKFHPSIDGAPVRRAHGLEHHFIIGYVGTLAGWHGLNLLFEVAAELREKAARPFAFLIVGGDGRKLEEHRASVHQAGLAEHLRFIGSVAHDEVPAHIRAMDLAIVPDTTYWSSPAKLFEYQASGVPVLAPSYPSIHEALDHDAEGLIFEPRDVKRIGELILHMMDRPDRLRAMSTAARARAEREHSWRHNGQQILELFEESRAQT